MPTTTWETTLTLESTPSVASEEALWLKRVQAGEPAATKVFVRRFYPQVQQLIAWHAPSAVEPDCLAEQVLLRVLRQLRFYFRATPLDDWVSHRICAACRAELRGDTRGRDDRLSSHDLCDSEHRVIKLVAQCNGQLSPEEEDTARAILEELILELKVADRFMIRLLDIEGMRLADVCALLGWPTSWVRIRAWLVRRRLRRRLNQLLRWD